MAKYPSSANPRRANATAPALLVNPQSMLRLPRVLDLVPVGKSAWWAGVKAGKFPRPVKLSNRITAWRARDILALTEGNNFDE